MASCFEWQSCLIFAMITTANAVTTLGKSITMNFDILEVILSVFFIALVVTVIFRQLKLSVILGYLFVGALVGPHALGLVPDTPSIKELAEFGIVFLMFTIGLEFSLPKLLSLKSSIFITGSLQILLSILITVAACQIFNLSILTGLVMGSIIAMSSTAIAGKQLGEQLEYYSSHGLNAIGILLLQDLAVVPLIILIAGLASNQTQNLGVILLWALAKGVLAIALILTLGHWLLKPLFRLIAKTRAIELFTLTVLLVTLTAAWITHWMGLSFALGALLAGIMLGETEFRHQIDVEIRPFRDILLGLFFITIGMLTDLSAWQTSWLEIVLLLLGLTLGKLILISTLCRLTGSEISAALRTGLILAQGGEFGFALLTLALNEKILSSQEGQTVLAALLLSIAISPIIIRFNKQIVRFLLLRTQKINDTVIQEKITHSVKKVKNHIIICGYGRVGQNLARMLDKVAIPYFGFDLDSELIKRASLAGENVIFGDPTHPGILKAARLKHAKVLVTSFNDLRATIKILQMVRPKYPNLPIVVRCHDENELKILKEHGATEIIAEIFEESLTMSYHLLNLLHLSRAKIFELIQEVRSKDYAMLQKVFTGTYDGEGGLGLSHLQPIVIPEGSFAVNKKLKDLQLRESGIEIVAMRRGEVKYAKPHGNTKLLAKDIIIAYGDAKDLEAAEEKLLMNL